jgi:hypothetical protein
MPATHVIVNTHTPERLRRTILGVLWQRPAPGSLTISCDSDHPGIEPVVRAAVDEASRTAPSARSVPTALILRPHTGKSRPAQARNNAVRHLLRAHAPQPSDALVFLDGDCVPAPDACARHARALERHALCLGWRYDLTPKQDAAFDEGALRDGRPPVAVTSEQHAALRARQRRLARQAALWPVRLGPLCLIKEHKPKVLGANFSCSIAAYDRVNGSDETYEGWAQEDDDLGRRIYRSGGRPAVHADTILVYHQYHLTRAPQDWRRSSNAHRLNEPCDTVCTRGVRSPLEQPQPRTISIL